MTGPGEKIGLVIFFRFSGRSRGGGKQDQLLISGCGVPAP